MGTHWFIGSVALMVLISLSLAVSFVESNLNANENKYC